MKEWEKPEIWELSAKYTECGIPIIPRCHSGGGSGSGSGSGSGGGSSNCGNNNGKKNKGKNKVDTGKSKNKKKQFNMVSWICGRYK